MEKKRLDGLIKLEAKKLKGGGALRLLKDKDDYYQIEFAISGQKPTLLLSNPKRYGDNREIEDIYERINSLEDFWYERDGLSLLVDSEKGAFSDLDDSACGAGDFSMEGSGTYGALVEGVDEDY